MRAVKYFRRYTAALFALGSMFVSARAQDYTNQEWLLDPANSSVYMLTLKANTIFEVQQFKRIEGNISSTGDANIKIDLASIDSGIDLRDTRLRFQLFETFKWRYAQINARLDKAKLQALATQTRLRMPLTVSVGMLGRLNDFTSEVWVTRVSDTTVSVTTITPIIVTAESFGLEKNIAKLVDAIGGTPITPAVTITFDLLFGAGALKATLETARVSREQVEAKTAVAAISAEDCVTRFTVLSETGAIRFKTGAAIIEPSSDAVLNSVAEIAKRCGTLKFDVHGHTDNVGIAANNLKLSHDRANAIIDHLQKLGVSASRMQSEGFGSDRPVKPNDTEAGRAENRRIEFKVRKE